MANMIFKISLTTLLLASTTLAQAPDLSAAVDKIFAWSKPNEPGCAVAALQDGKLVINKTYGSADLERDVPIGPNTLFDAGSIRKQFVAASILLLAEEGKLSLTDDVRKYIPELPDYGHKITIDHLLTHTSGIRDWQPLLNLAGGDPTAMSMILRQRELNFKPGDEWSYSNSGYVLLPEIVTRVSGTPFAQFVQKRVFEPAGMRSSTYVDDPRSLVKARALAYSKEKDQWKWDMYLGNERGGAGALYTTPVDLVAWNDALRTNRLGAALTQKLLGPTVLNSGRKLTYARGKQVEPFREGGVLVWHGGGAGGYSAREVSLPQQGVSVATTCNGDNLAADTGRILDLLVPGSFNETPPSTNPNSVELGDLRAKTGLFLDEKTGEPLRIGANPNGLMIAGGGPLVALAPDTFKNMRTSLFFMSEADVELKFLSGDRIELKTKEGDVSHYRHAAAWTPTADDLKALAGSYRSDELLATFDATPTKSGLNVQANNANIVEFKPAEKDVFQIGQSLIRFTRDSSGKVTGLVYSNPVLRGVKFTRTEIRP